MRSPEGPGADANDVAGTGAGLELEEVVVAELAPSARGKGSVTSGPTVEADAAPDEPGADRSPANRVASVAIALAQGGGWGCLQPSSERMRKPSSFPENGATLGRLLLTCC